MKKIDLSRNIKLVILISVVLLGKINAQNVIMPSPGLEGFDSRKEMIIDSIAKWASTFTLEDFKNSDHYEGGKYGAYPVMALFERGYIEKGRAFAAQQLIGGAAMFREFSTMALYMEYHELYGEALCEKVKQDQLQSNFFFVEEAFEAQEHPDSHRNPRLGGASENHKLMYAAAAYLAGLTWPDEYPKEWYETGYDHLMRWFDIVTSVGFWEQDSPTYLIHHLGPILSVADHAPEGSLMKKKATMVLDWYFASIAGEYLHGYWITAAARDYNPIYGLAISAETTALTWLMFGDAPQIPNPHTDQPFRHWKATLHFAVSDYRVPDFLVKIATAREDPFVHKEFMSKNPMRPKEYCYINKTYGMASILEEDAHNIPPDMTRWKVQWITSDPAKEPTAFFMKHPNESDNWEAWRGASGAEQVVQYKGTLLAVYNINEERYPFIEAPFRQEVFEEVIIENDWLFLNTGTTFLAVNAIKGLEFSKEKRISDSHGPELELQVLRSVGRRNGLIVQSASILDYNGQCAAKPFKQFISDILTKTKIDFSGIHQEYPELIFTNINGDKLEIKYDHYKKVNGSKIEFENWPLLGDPWIFQEYKGDSLVFTIDGRRIIYDFNTWEIYGE